MSYERQASGGLQLCVFLDERLRRVIAVPESGLTIGRDSENDLQLDDPLVSRCHARLSYAHGRLWLEDCQSANGTLVEGRPVDRRAVGPGDPIEIGPFRLALQPESAVSPSALSLATARVDAPALPHVGQAGELTTLISLLESFDVKAPREELLPRLLSPLLGAMDAERAFLYRADTRHGTVRRVFEHRVPGSDDALPVSETAVQQVARDRTPRLISDLIGEGADGLASLDRLAAARVRSVLIAPLTRGRKLVGVLYLDSASARHRFVSGDLALLERAASCLAGLLDSVELTAELVRENVILRGVAEEAGGEVPLERLHAPGSPMARVVEHIQRAAGKNVTVLLRGETGTGKEVAARALHRLSRRRGRFIAINCGAVPDALVESELFGYRQGAFSGANEDRPGLIELAHDGTLFLDEVGELPHAVQVKLLRVLEERVVQRLGAAEATPVDFRLVAATHRDLASRVTEGTFRQDLMYRLDVFPITMPPLRERPMDLALLVEHLVEVLALRVGSTVSSAAPDIVTALAAHDWPGNVRELRNVLERALVVEESESGLLTAASLQPWPPVPLTASGSGRPPGPVAAAPVGPVRPFHEELREFERVYFRRLLAQIGQSVAAMARSSGLTRLTIYRKLGALGIEKDDPLPLPRPKSDRLG